MPTRNTSPRLADLKADLRQLGSAKKAASSAWFFKTGPGQYGEGDRFVGVTVPEQRTIARRYRDLPLRQVVSLLKSPIHEDRAVALMILVGRFQSATRRRDEAKRKEIYDLYFASMARVNNWDLVDGSAPYIVGGYLIDKRKDVLVKLARSSNVWERRIAMIATHDFIRRGDATWALKIARMLKNDKHDLIQKAVGWMLRELGKRCDEHLLTDFLDQHAAAMARTALRYAIERLPERQRRAYMST